MFGSACPLPRLRRSALRCVITHALMMVVPAVSGLNVALPGLAINTGASQTQLTWIVDASILACVGILLPLGARGDRLGRRRVLLAGLLIFGSTAAALVGTLSVVPPSKNAHPSRLEPVSSLAPLLGLAIKFTTARRCVRYSFVSSTCVDVGWLGSRGGARVSTARSRRGSRGLHARTAAQPPLPERRDARRRSYPAPELRRCPERHVRRQRR